MGKDPMETYKPLVDYKGGEEGWDWSPTPN